MSASRPNDIYDLSGEAPAGQRLFKKHKVLPHPARRRDDGWSLHDLRPKPKRYDLVVDTAATHRHASQPTTSSSNLNHNSRRIRSGPVLPPTPPAHSRTSSSSHSIHPSSPTYVETPSRSLEEVGIHVDRPATPPNQNSPPTPDETPPQPPSRPKALRPVFGDRTVSKTTTDSRTESFRTAREEPWTSEEDGSKSTARPTLPSTRTSQTTVRRISDDQPRKPQSLGLGLNLDRAAPGALARGTKGEFIKFDGDWASSSEVEQEWDDNFGRNVIVRKGRKAPEDPEMPLVNGHSEVFEDKIVAPTNAIKALRSMSLQDSAPPHPTRKAKASRRGTTEATPSSSDPSISPDRRRHSGMSSKSNVSTVVEAMLVGGHSPPQRKQTLRHVRKLRALRDSGSNPSVDSSVPSSSVRGEEVAKPPRPPVRQHEGSHGRHESYTSTATCDSISSHKARREVWKNGGIPVVVVPNRRSSSKAGGTPSLRSTSSRRTRRSLSVNSAPLTNRSRSNEPTPVFDRPSRRGRTMSESDGSNQRTMDYPPAIPARSSSLSAPTSRNNSRAGSMTAESLKSRNTFLNQDPSSAKVPIASLHRAPSFEAGQEDHLSHKSSHHKLEVDHLGDPFFGERLSTQKTPFSIKSIETNGTAPEVWEAKAVSIYPHQNSSVLMVDHSQNPSEPPDGSQREQESNMTPEKPVIAATPPDSDHPVTPPRSRLALEDVDSPLRNPRAPPEPPVINFIPATPSGSTPLHEQQHMMGNYFETVREEKPQRSMSLVRRALTGRRRHSVSYPPKTRRSGFLARTLSLSRHVRRGSEAPIDGEIDPLEEPPPEDNKLHPNWRPSYAEDDYDLDEDDRVYRYPPVDNRPKRTLSSRMKQTFAILPVREDDEYSVSSREGPEKRTIRRTPSGNLRVVRRRSNSDTDRPSTAPEGETEPKSAWHKRAEPKEAAQPERRRRFSVSGTLGDLHGLPRRFSEKRREKRTQELRSSISRPREVRDGVGDIIQRRNFGTSPQ